MLVWFRQQTVILIQVSFSAKSSNELDRWQLHLQYKRAMGECHAIIPEWNFSDRSHRKNAREELDASALIQQSRTSCNEDAESRATVS